MGKLLTCVTLRRTGTYAEHAHQVNPRTTVRWSIQPHFASLLKEKGYAGAIEMDPKSMVSSHQIKRFFCGFSLGRIWLF